MLRNVKPPDRRNVSPARSYRRWILYLQTSGEQIESGKMFGLAALLGLALAVPALGQTAVDGDTIVNGTTYRIWGIDAHELHQPCLDGWPGGIELARMLEGLVLGKRIECEFRGRDRYGRSIGLCRADARDLGADMVGAGMAWAFTRYSSDYIDEERSAIGNRVGVHAHDCEKPWDWRARSRGDR
jgi:endonuclease YncB( thermonuclease family)